MSGKYGGGGVPCAICKKSVYPAELLSFEKKKYHVRCFKCDNCGKKMTPNSAKVHPETGVLYDKHCFTKLGFANLTVKVVWKKKTTTSGDVGSSKGGSNKFSGKFGGNSVPCTACGKSAYIAEVIKVKGKPYHAKCLVCRECNKHLDLAGKCMTFTHEGDKEQSIYCDKCFAHKNLNREQAKVKWEKGKNSTGSSKGSGKYGGGGKKCAKCGKTAHLGEQIHFGGEVYHPNCFTCKDCGKKMNVSDAKKFKLNLPGHEQYFNNLYCTKHWDSNGLSRLQTSSASKKWKQTTGGSSGGTGSKKYGGGGKKCFVCAKTVYSAEAVHFEKHVYHEKCLICTDCQVLIKNVNQLNIYDDKLKCKKCWKDNLYSTKQTVVARKQTSKVKKVDKRFKQFGGGGTKCVKCDKTVYPAETIRFEKNAYHSGCFKCLECDVKLKVGTATYKKQPDGSIKIYCSQCFNVLGLGRATINKHDDIPPQEEPTQELERTTLD